MSEVNEVDGVVSCDELKIIAFMVIRMTEMKLKECGYLDIENFSGSLFSRLLYEYSMHKRGMVRFVDYG